MHDLRERGFDCLAMSMPGQDASPVKQVGFGIAEGHTIVDAVKWVRSRSKHAVKVVAVGVSMGGAGAWLASEEDPTIDGVVTESAFARFTPALKQFFDCKVRGMSVALSPMITIAKWMTALDPDGVLPVRAAEKWRGRPSLVIQAGDDVVITRDQGESLAAAAGCPLWIVPGAGHSQCYRVSGGPYVEHLVGFAKGLTG
jgi:pimeloyl-ACP methyl ester carboxylesterase